MDKIRMSDFIGSIKINLENCIKYIAIIAILLDNLSNGSGLIAPVNVGENHSEKLITDDDRMAMNHSSIDYSSTNSINDEYMMELPSSSSQSLSSSNINKTFFMSSNNSVITSQVGSIVHLPCRVHLIGDEMISWIRRKDYHLLTVGLAPYSSDARFSAIHNVESGDWQLIIKFVQLRDSGVYECAVNSHPSISLFIQLEITESRAEIDGPIEKFLRIGSSLRLVCKVIGSIENPIYLFWYHNSRMINHDIHLGFNVTIESDNKFSELLILQTAVGHSGNYTCSPSNAMPASTVVHILNGENPIGLAAYGASANAKNQSIYVQAFLLLFGIATYQFITILQIS